MNAIKLTFLVFAIALFSTPASAQQKNFKVAATQAGLDRYVFTVYAQTPRGINNRGDFVGNIVPNIFVQVTAGFVSDGVSRTLIQCTPGTNTNATDISDSAEIAGFCEKPPIGDVGYLLDRGGFTFIRFDGSSNTRAFSINNRGQIVGTSFVSSPVSSAVVFVYDRGEFTTIPVPAPSSTVPTRINDRGQIVGFYTLLPGPGATFHGFLFQDGVFTTIDVPGASSTMIMGINNRDQLIGNYVDSLTNTSQGFVYDHGAFVRFDAPGCTGIALTDNNDRGQISGTCADSNGSHGFIATPKPAK